jgi:hypothetical protein
MPVRRYKQHCNIVYERFAAGDCVMLYNAWSSMYIETSADAAFDRFTVAVTQTINFVQLFLRAYI